MGSYRKGLLLSLGSIIQVQVDLQTVVPSTRSSLRRLCPEHHLPIKQSYACPEGHPITEWVNGKETAEGWKIVKPEDRPDFDADDALELVPVPADELEARTFAGNGMYYCQPTSTVGHEAWSVLHKVLTKGKIAFITKGALRKGGQKIWRVDVFRDYLVLKELVFPENIKAVPEQVDVRVPKATQTLVDQFIDSLLVEWDKVDTADETAKRIEEWIAAGETIEADTKTRRVAQLDVSSNVVDLQERLKAAVKETVKKG